MLATEEVFVSLRKANKELWCKASEGPLWSVAGPLYLGGLSGSSACNKILSSTLLSFSACLPAPPLWSLTRSLVLAAPTITYALVLSCQHSGRQAHLACSLSLMLALWLCGQIWGAQCGQPRAVGDSCMSDQFSAHLDCLPC